MSLGVLNNLNAIYAENNLNNTSNSLSTVLQQLSSGSKINSGADDAAGLSLVNGLQANAQALTQSKTNSTEGVGLLKVADGALSQVTNLLNRAVTLATEAANGTLNASQDTAANQEYLSILSEINNIGTTTTYNQEQVFGSTTNIYTGDSSTAGSSIDALNIRSLSSSNLGDSSGVMAYSSGANNVFLDLSSAGKNAAVTDSLGIAAQTTTIAVNYLTKGAGGAAVQATANISVGAGTTYSNTAQGLISAINGSGLGLNATFGTATQAGTTAVSLAGAADTAGGTANDTGIIISGSGVGTGTNGAGEIGTLTVAAAADALGGTLNVKDASGVSHALTLGAANSTDNVANLAATINAAGYGVTAAVNNSVVGGHAVGTVLTFTSANSAVSVAGTSLTDAGGATALTGVPLAAGASFSATVGSITTSNANQAYTGGTLTIGSNAAITLGAAGTNSAAALAATINAGNYGVTASLDAAGKVLTFTSANSSDTFASTATVGAGTVTNATAVADHTQIGTLKLTGGTSGSADVLTTGSTIQIGGTTFTSTAGQTMVTFAAAITAANAGITATATAVNATDELITFKSTSAATQGIVLGNALGMTDLTHGAATFAAVADTPSTDNSAYYSVGISGNVADTTTGGGTLNTGLVVNTNGSGGVATISYSDAAGVSLSSTDLSTQSTAQAALSQINAAISSVSAQDGYIGAQINTLNSVSEVLATQSENVTSAQNAVQATDYASATSNMSKYEILSQTGISALAQANSMQQEVTKLLQ